MNVTGALSPMLLGPIQRPILGVWYAAVAISFVAHQTGNLLTKADASYQDAAPPLDSLPSGWVNHENDHQGTEEARWRDALTATGEAAFPTVTVQDTVAITEDLPGKEFADDAAFPKPSGAAATRPLTRRSMTRLTLAALVCLGLLAFYSWPATKKPGPFKVVKEPDAAGEPSEEAMTSFQASVARLELMQALYPSARTLAATVARKEALDTLEKLNQCLLFAQQLRGEVEQQRLTAEDVQKPQNQLLDESLAALNRLQKVAGEHASEVALELCAGTPALLNEKEFVLTEKAMGTEFTATLGEYLTSLKSHSQTLKYRALEALERISACKPFLKIEDTIALASTASNMRFLADAKTALLRAQDKSAKQVEGLMTVTKSLFVAEERQKYRELQGMIEIYGLSCKLARRICHATADDEQEKIMETIAASEDLLRKGMGLLAKLQEEIEDLHDAGTLIDLGAAHDKSQVTARTLTTVLETTLRTLQSLPDFDPVSSDGDEEMRQAMVTVVSRSRDVALKAHSMLQKAIIWLREHPSSLGVPLPETDLPPSKYVNPNMLKLLTESVERLASAANSSALWSVTLADDMASGKHSAPFKAMARQAQTASTRVCELSEQAERLRMQFHLIASLEYDMQESSALLNHAAAYSFDPAGQAGQEAELLREQFKEAVHQAERSWGPHAIAKAATRMRAAAYDLYFLVLKDAAERAERGPD